MVGSGAVHIGSWSCRVSRLISRLAPAASSRTAMPASTSGTGWPTTSPPTLIYACPMRSRTTRTPPRWRPTSSGRLLGVGPGLTPRVMTCLLGSLSGYGPSARGPSPCDWRCCRPASLLRPICRPLCCGARPAGVDPPGEPTAASHVRDRVAGSARPRDDDLIRVGHTSGAALATGVLAAATPWLGGGEPPTKLGMSVSSLSPPTSPVAPTSSRAAI